VRWSSRNAARELPASLSVLVGWHVSTLPCLQCAHSTWIHPVVCLLQVERLLPLCECVYTVKRFVETRSRIDHPKVAQVRRQLPSSPDCINELASSAACSVQYTL
jgi:hypothetical protein